MIQELPGKGVTSVSQHRISLKVAADIKSRVSFDSGIESFSCFEQVTQPMVVLQDVSGTQIDYFQNEVKPLYHACSSILQFF